jgi:phosphoribosyl-ATP pyrophosphohydrolase
MKDLIQRNYNAVVARKLISEATTDKQFWEKLSEEYDEVYQPYMKKDRKELSKELTDVMVVCVNWLTHMGFDIPQLLEQNAIKNEERAKNGL